MNDTSGPSFGTPFAHYDPDSSCLRMSQGTFLLDSIESSPTLPASGSMRTGRLYERPTLEPAISGPACSSSLPTPSANQYEMGDVDAYLERRERQKALGRNGNGFGLVLSMAVKMLPTPTTDDASNVTQDSGEFQSLAREMHNLLPTPQAHDAQGGKTPEQVAAMRERGHGVSNLNEVVPHLFLPTPNSSDYKGATTPEAAKDWEFRGVNLPERIQRLRGASTSPPSDATNESSDGQLPLL